MPIALVWLAMSPFSFHFLLHERRAPNHWHFSSSSSFVERPYFHIPAYQQIYIYIMETKLFSFFMQSMFFAEFAIFIDFNTIWIVLFVFGSLVVTLFALGASQSNAIACSNSHSSTPHLQLNIYHPKLLPI